MSEAHSADTVGRSIAIMVAVVCGIAGVAAAHEGHRHGAHTMKGTVTAVDADRGYVEMKTIQGETTGFYVDAKTKFLKGKASSELAALQPGTRVVVEGKTMDGKMVATTVRIGAAARPSAHAAPAHHGGHPHFAADRIVEHQPWDLHRHGHRRR